MHRTTFGRHSLACLKVTVLAAILAVPVPALAQTEAPTAPTAEADDKLTDLAIEDLLNVKVDTVYAASKFVQEISQAPASVSIITSEEIRSHGYRTLADVLRTVRGFYVTYDRNYSYVGVRGFSRPGDYNSRVLVLLNGHQLNDTIFEEALLGTESPIDIGLVQRVEVIRGPSSSLYGTNAFFAVVNIVTRTGRMLNGVEAEGLGGSLLTRSGRVTAGGKTKGGVEGLFSVSGFEARGNRQLSFQEFVGGGSNGIAYDADGDRSGSVFASATAGGWQVQTGYGSRRKIVPTASFGTSFNDPRTQTTDARGFADVQFTHNVGPRLTLITRGSYDQYDYDGTYAYDEGLFRDGAHASWITGQFDVVRRFDRQNLTAGVEYRDNLRQNQQATDWTGVLLNDRRGSQSAAIYVEDEFRINQHLLVNGGLRWDQYFDTFGGTVNPRFGVIVSPRSGSALKLLYGRAFRAPNPFELYYYQNETSAGLAPERISTHELVWEQRVDARVQLTASLFHNNVRDLITQRYGSDTSTIDGLYYENEGGVSATGVELEAQAELPGHVLVRASQVAQKASDAATGGKLSNSPDRLANVIVDAPLARSGLRVGFTGTFVGARRTVRDSAVPSALVSGITVSGPHPQERFAFAISVHNLFNAAYGDPGSEEHRQDVIPQDGRTIDVRATWRF